MDYNIQFITPFPAGVPPTILGSLIAALRIGILAPNGNKFR